MYIYIYIHIDCWLAISYSYPIRPLYSIIRLLCDMCKLLHVNALKYLTMTNTICIYWWYQNMVSDFWLILQSCEDLDANQLMCLRIHTSRNSEMRCQVRSKMWGPVVKSWSMTPPNYGYYHKPSWNCNYEHQLSYRSGAPHCKAYKAYKLSHHVSVHGRPWAEEQSDSLRGIAVRKQTLWTDLVASTSLVWFFFLK